MLESVVVAAATAHAALALRRAPAWTVDDAWIVVRYAENLAHHGVLAFNLDGPRVEGFTSLSAVLLASLASVLHVAPMKAMVVAGEIAFLLGGALVLALGRSVRAPPLAAGAVAVVHLTLAEHVTHATSGLETEPFIALGLALALTAARALREPRCSIVPVAIVGFVLTITRPEGAAAAAIALAIVLQARARDRAVLRRDAVRAAAWYALPMALVTAWRIMTYGSVVPNTYFAKRTGWNGAHVGDLWTLVNAHFLDLVVVAMAAVAVVALVAGRGPRIWQHERRMLTIAALVLLAHLAAYARSEPMMDFGRRFAMHGLPWLDVGALVAVSVALRSLRRAPGALAAAPALVIVLAVGSAVLRGRDAEATEAGRMTSYARAMDLLCAPTATWIVDHTAPDATIAVYPDAGCVPYLSRRRTIDFGRLNDAALARSTRAPANVAAYFFVNDPDVLVASRPRPGELWDDGAQAIVADPRFQTGYELAFQRDTAEGVGYVVYRRRPR